MKKTQILSLVTVIAIVFSSCGGGENNGDSKAEKEKKVEISIEKENYQVAEKEALIVLKAYADKDFETLKQYAEGTQKMVLDNTYFTDNSNAAGFIEKINHWEGSFKEIRYYEDEINFQKYYYAVAAFYESPSGQITAIGLKSTDKENWLMSGFATRYIKKDEFEALSTELPE